MEVPNASITRSRICTSRERETPDEQTQIALSTAALAPLLALHAQDAACDAAIRAIVAEQVVAWNAGDGRRYAEHLGSDAPFTNLFGMVMYGASAFAKRHDEILSTFYSQRRCETSEVDGPVGAHARTRLGLNGCIAARRDLCCTVGPGARWPVARKSSRSSAS